MEKKYTYNDFSIVPAVISNISSRSQCNPFLSDGSLPLFTAPMDSVVGMNNYNKWAKIHAIIPRTIDIQTRLELSKEHWIAVSLNEFKEYFVDSDSYSGSRVLIDVANGHMSVIYDLVKLAKQKNNSNLTIMVGNIANPETYRVAEEAGVDYIRCGIGAGRGCFVKGTLVSMYDGKFKPIEEIKPGDEVLTHNFNCGVVTNVINLVPESNHLIRINGTITCTPNHKFYVSTNEEDTNLMWIEACDLKLYEHALCIADFDDDLLEDKFKTIPITKIEKIYDIPLEVYDITVEGDHSYFADGFAVHNCITSSNTSVHYPMASLISETYAVKKSISGKCKIVADGGIRNYSDVIKALALGADFVMIGSVFTKMLESAAQTYFSYVTGSNEWHKFSYDPELHKYEDGRFYDYNPVTNSYDEIKLKKEFYGMASKKGQIAMNGRKTRTSEGLSTILPVEYTMESWTTNFIDYLRSAMSYTGFKEIQDFIGGPNIVLLSEGVKESVNK